MWRRPEGEFLDDLRRRLGWSLRALALATAGHPGEAHDEAIPISSIAKYLTDQRPRRVPYERGRWLTLVMGGTVDEWNDVVERRILPAEAAGRIADRRLRPSAPEGLRRQEADRWFGWDREARRGLDEIAYALRRHIHPNAPDADHVRRCAAQDILDALDAARLHVYDDLTYTDLLELRCMAEGRRADTPLNWRLDQARDILERTFIGLRWLAFPDDRLGEAVASFVGRWVNRRDDPLYPLDEELERLARDLGYPLKDFGGHVWT